MGLLSEFIVGEDRRFLNNSLYFSYSALILLLLLLPYYTGNYKPDKLIGTTNIVVVVIIINNKLEVLKNVTVVLSVVQFLETL